MFALGSEDLSITINNLEGDTLQTFSCNGDIYNLQIFEMRQLDDVESDKPEDYVGFNIIFSIFEIEVLVKCNYQSQKFNDCKSE